MKNKLCRVSHVGQGYGIGMTTTRVQLDTFRKGMEFHGGSVKDFIIRVDDDVYTFDLKDMAEFCTNKKGE